MGVGFLTNQKIRAGAHFQIEPTCIIITLMISQWVPKLERTILLSGIFAGTTVGSAFTFGFTGFICDEINWEAAFIIPGLLGFLWCFGWFFLVHDSPAK